MFDYVFSPDRKQRDRHEAEKFVNVHGVDSLDRLQRRIETATSKRSADHWRRIYKHARKLVKVAA